MALKRPMKVLIPIDWSENAEKAFEWYLEKLHHSNATLILVHFIDAANDKELREKEAKMMELQESYENKLLHHQVQYRWLTGTGGSPGEYIIRVATEEDVGLILMGTRGLGKIRKAILGSVSDYVLNKLVDYPVMASTYDIGSSWTLGGRIQSAAAAAAASTASPSPVDGERTIYVNDDGLLDTGSYDQLTAEFRYRLGLLPEDDQELSQVFMVRIGLATVADRKQIERMIDEIDRAMSTGGRHRDETMRKNNMELFARKRFQPSSPPLQYSPLPLKRPLLAKNNDVEKRASLAIWFAIKRFIDGVSQKKSSSASKGQEAPIISRVWDQLETIPVNTAPKNQQTRKSSSITGSSDQSAPSTSFNKRVSLKKLFRTNSSTPTSRMGSSGGADYVRDSIARRQSMTSTSSSSSEGANIGDADEDCTAMLTDDFISSIPTTELDLVNYIIAHGILREELRDEIYCQLCCQVSKNPSIDSRRRGWILHCLCAGSFLPSLELLSYYYAFLYDVLLADTLHYAANTRHVLRRTNANGMRFHPSSSLELKALKDQKAMILDVTAADGRHVLIEADSATTASEVCDSVGKTLNIKDNFGFSLFISINGRISSLGCGLDHVMDAITECEQLFPNQGRPDSAAAANWRFFYHKELFTPWYNPGVDPVATELIFRQIIKGVQNEDYRLHADDVCTFVARCMYVDFGRQLTTDIVKSKMADYLPKSFLANNNSKSRDPVVKSIMAACESQGFTGYAAPAKYVQLEMVATASEIWPTHFSAMFETYRVGGPPLFHNDVIIAINSGGVFLLDNKFDVMVGFHYYDLVEAEALSVGDTPNNKHPAVKLVAIDGVEFQFLSANAETISRIVTAFLDGLRRRSQWAIATESFNESRSRTDTAAGVQCLSLRLGDVIELTGKWPPAEGAMTSQQQTNDELWMTGRNERTGDKGRFPAESVYIVPTIDKPAAEFFAIVKSLTNDRGMDTLASRTSNTATTRRRNIDTDDDVVSSANERVTGVFIEHSNSETSRAWDSTA